MPETTAVVPLEVTDVSPVAVVAGVVVTCEVAVLVDWVRVVAVPDELVLELVMALVVDVLLEVLAVVVVVDVLLEVLEVVVVVVGALTLKWSFLVVPPTKC